MKKGAKNLKEIGKEYKGRFGGRKGEGKCCNYNVKKRKENIKMPGHIVQW